MAPLNPPSSTLLSFAVVDLLHAQAQLRRLHALARLAVSRGGLPIGRTADELMRHAKAIQSRELMRCGALLAALPAANDGRAPGAA